MRLLPLNMIARGPQLASRGAELLEQLLRGELSLPVSVRPLAEVGAALDELRSGRVVGRIALAP